MQWTIMVDKYLSRFIRTEQGLQVIILIIHILYKEVSIINKIGQMLKEAREKSSVSLEEASKDIHIKEVILENIESGSMGSFKDIYELKSYLETYAKYLGLNVEKILNEFNEYMFEYTSKIPLKEIEKQVMEQNKDKSSEEISSPYSKPSKKYSMKTYIFIYIIIFVIVVFAIIWSIGEIYKSQMESNIEVVL